MDIDERQKQFSTNKNSAGRPLKKHEIKFTPPPQSMISLLLSKQKSNDNNFKKIIKTIDSDSKNAEPTQHNLMDGELQDLSDINKHSVELQKDKLYECKFSKCKYSTKFPSNLRMHERVHSNDQPYICDKCAFKSKYLSSLNTHQRLHKDEKPFSCKYCNYKCNSSSNLKKHNARKHMEHSKK